MIYPGLVSVTFRKLEPAEIMDLAVSAGLTHVEWGGDVHANSTGNALRIKNLMDKKGVICPSYGSYYRCGGGDFEREVEIAAALSAKNIRVWAGEKGSFGTEKDYVRSVSKDLARICQIAAEKGITVSLEYHGNTLTDTLESSVNLVDSVEAKNLFIYWQPPFLMGEAENLSAIRLLGEKGKISNIHVFHWDKGPDGGICRLSLEEGKGKWERYISELSALPGDRYAFLEFVRNDSPEDFIKDALVLRSLLQATASQRN